MRQSFFFKAFFLVLFMSSSQLILAQNSSKTSCERRNSTNVEIDMSKNQQLSLQDNDAHFNMNLRFKKEHTNELREMLSQELGHPNSNVVKKQVWASKNGAYSFELKEGHIYINIIKNKLEEAEYESLKNVGTATLKLVGFSVDLDVNLGKFYIHIN